MVNQPDQDSQGVHTPARKLVLPEPPDAGQQRQRYSSPRSARFINLPISAASHGLFTHVLHRWRTDPAFALLSLAIALALISAFVLVGVGVNTLTSASGAPVWNKAMTQHPAVPSPTGTLDLKPKFPVPSTHKGSSTSSQPPPNTQPTNPDNPDQGTLDVQILNIPNAVNNQSQVQVDIQTSEPNVQVLLEVTYNASPFRYTSREAITDDNGNVVLNWIVRVRSFSNSNNVVANVIIIATDRNGQQATSDPATVEIVQ